jgi:uncharacterized protein with FMN-binding domain
MNSKTKIVVIHMRELIIGAVIAVAVIILLIVTIIALSGKGSGADNTSHTNSSKTTSTNTSHTYTPGVYTATITLNGTPVDIRITVDKHNINSIEMVNLSDSVTTMYPMLSSNFDELANAVIANGSTTNIPYDSDSKYTTNVLLDAIQTALDKCTVK